MAKRRAEDTLLHDSPSKRCHRSVCSVDMQLGSIMAPTGGVSPPSLLALLGSRSRKRPHYFEEPEEEEGAAPFRKATNCDTRKHAATVLTVQTFSGSFHERRGSSAPTSSKKRTREGSTSSETAASKANDKAEEDTNAEDDSYNSFQYWRTPLPELDLSLLEDPSDGSQTKDKAKVKDPSSSSYAMET
ncbi:uncharacterized protein C9orf40 homolog [Dicentrarchus labrax]|uniref:uncharacterized protein C9orf40 homolog n=1 Tax=Dicentrarchus labrax TaxID=13489 RepID=UPI0021F56819|nr:uncharacterized protein C9orf40 homolog [Dicentrarchus labrax]